MISDRQAPTASRWTFALYALGGLLLYRGVLDMGLISDDFVLLDGIRRGQSMASWGRDQGGFFRPVTIASFWLDERLLGPSPVRMHVENVLLHAWSAVLVHALWLRRAEAGSPRWPAAVAGALFLAHPGHAEVVSWIAGRGDLLATALGLLGVLLGLDHARGGSHWRLAGAGAAWTAAVFSKESALAAPGILVALAAIPPHGLAWRRLLAGAGTGAAVIALAAAARLAVFGTLVSSTGGSHRLVMSTGKLVGSIERQVLRTFLPATPSGDAASLVGAVLVGGLLALVVLLTARELAAGSRRRALAAGLLGPVLAYACALVPVVGSKVHVDTVEGERFVLLATAFAALGVATALAGLRGRRLGPALGIAWVLVYALLLQRAALRWASAGAYAERVVEALVSASRGPRPLVLALPDSVEGASVFRNGLREAVAWRRADLEVTVLATFTADGRGGGARAERSAERAGAWELALAGPRPYQQVRSPALVLDSWTDGGLVVETTDLSAFSDLFLFRDGELVRLGP